MTRRLAAILVAMFWMTLGWAWAGDARQVRVKWDELGARLPHHKVALVLPDSTQVEGRVIGVEAGGLRLKVTKSSNRRVQPKGEQLIPRQSLSVLRVTEYRKLGRLLVTAGAVGAAAVIVATSYPDINEGTALIAVPAVTAAGLAGIAVGGYYAGKAIDKRVTEITIEPDRP